LDTSFSGCWPARGAAEGQDGKRIAAPDPTKDPIHKKKLPASRELFFMQHMRASLLTFSTGFLAGPVELCGTGDCSTGSTEHFNS
jgi:hypothetical protein